MEDMVLCVGATIVFVGAVGFLSWITRPPRTSDLAETRAFDEEFKTRFSDRATEARIPRTEAGLKELNILARIVLAEVVKEYGLNLDLGVNVVFSTGGVHIEFIHKTFLRKVSGTETR